MISGIIAFVIMLNPFALFLYLAPIMQELDDRRFRVVLTKATLISLAIYLLFTVGGDFLFQEVFQIRFESFRVFGGIVIFSFAYFFIVKGQHALIHMKENLDDLASEIALPFMVGAGTISLTIIMSHTLLLWEAGTVIVSSLIINYLIIMGLKYFRHSIKQVSIKTAFDKNVAVLLRLNAFFMGAIGINMVLGGIAAIL